MSKSIYKINVKNWGKYNGSLKRGHKCILLSTGFLSDAKIMSLPIGGRLLYLGLLLRCGEVTCSTIEASQELLVSFAGGPGQRVPSLLEQMQEIQLLTFEILTLSPKGIKLKGSNRIEGPEQQKAVALRTPAQPPSKVQITINSVEQLFATIPKAHWDNWAKAFDREYMRLECVKMTAWLLANPNKNRKSLKGLLQFVGSWFNRGWDKWLQTGPSNKPDDGWEKKAMIVRDALQKFGSGTKEQVELEQFMGPELYPIAVKAGIYNIRQMKAGDFYLKTLAGMLRSASETLNQSPGGAN